MISSHDKNILYFILSFLDACLVTILLFQIKKLNKFDLVYIACMFVSHFVLFLSLWNKWYTMIDILHYFLFLSILLAIFIHNVYLQALVLFLVALIQVLWIYKGRCILNTIENENFWGFCNELTVATLAYTVLLSIKLGKTLS